MKSKSKGKLGECIARIYLRLHLYKILEKNFKTNTGEIDIIAKKGKTIVLLKLSSELILKRDYLERLLTIENKSIYKIQLFVI